MSIDNLSFCWNGIVSTDVDKTLAFLPAVLGWTVNHVEMGDETIPMLAHDGVAKGHVRAPAMDGEPSWWNNYLRVEDVDATAAAVVAAGGKVIVPGTDIPPGRFSTVTTPSGACFTLFHEAGNDRADEQGTNHWVELHSKDLAADLACLTEAVGFATAEMPMPQGPYTLLKTGEDMRAGAMTGMHPEAPSMWLAWVAVSDVDATMSRAETSGGKVVAPAFDVEGIGRMGIVSDPTGLVFGVITPPATA